MAIKAIWGLDHITSGRDVSGGTIPTYSGLPVKVTNMVNNYQHAGISTLSVGQPTGGNWIGLDFASTGWPAVRMTVDPLSSIMDITTPKSTFGFRFVQSGTLLPTVAHVFMEVNGVIKNLLPAAAYPWVVNKEYFVEIELDRVKKQVTIWVDNYIVMQFAMDFTGQVATDRLMFSGGTLAYVTGGSVWLKDFYFVDDTQDGGENGRLGPIKATMMTIDTTSANEWIPNSGTSDPANMTAILNTIVSPAQNYNPCIKSPPSGDKPITAYFKLPSAPAAGTRVKGYAIVGSSRRDQATIGYVKATMVDKDGNRGPSFEKHHPSDIQITNSLWYVNGRDFTDGNLDVTKIGKLGVELSLGE